MVARVATDVFALVKLVVVLHILLHRLANGVILVVVHYVRIGHVLGVDAAATLDHWKLLSIEVFIRIRSEASTNGFLLILLIVATGGQIR